MTNIVQLTRGQKGWKKITDYREWGPEGPGPSSPCAGRGRKDDPNVAPFRTTRLAVMRSKRFLSHLILMSKEQNQITMRKVSVVIQSLFSRRLNHHSIYS